MLRRNNENAMEFLAIERALEQLAPGRLSLERKIALRDRIFSQLGPQEVPWRSAGSSALRTRWVAVPAGIGIAAAIIATLEHLGQPQPGDGPAETRQAAAPEFSIIGSVDGPVERGKLVTARTTSWITHGRSVFGLEAGSSVIFRHAEHDSYHVVLISGELNVATDVARVHVAIGGSTAELAPGGSAAFTRTDALSTVSALRGVVVVSSGGATLQVSPGDGPLWITPAGKESVTGGDALSIPSAGASSGPNSPSMPQPPASTIDDGLGTPALTGQAPSELPPPQSSTSGNGPAAHAPGPPEQPAPGDSQAGPPQEPGEGQGQGNPAEEPGEGSQGTPPTEPGSGNGQGNPPESPGGGNGNPEDNPPEDPGGNPPPNPGGGNGNAEGNPPQNPGGGNGNAEGNPPQNPGGSNGNAEGKLPQNPGGGNGNAEGNPPQNPGGAHGQGGGNPQGKPQDDPRGGNGEANGNASGRDKIQVAQALGPASHGAAGPAPGKSGGAPGRAKQP